MTIFIGADHRGFQLKDILLEYIQEKNIRVEDMGNYEYEAEDDYTDYAQKVATAVLQNPEGHLGIVICGSGVGVCMTANRNKGIYCGLGMNPEHVKHARENDHINVLSLASENNSVEDNKKMVDAFLEAQPIHKKKYERRLEKLDAITASPPNTSPHSP